MFSKSPPGRRFAPGRMAAIRSTRAQCQGKAWKDDVPGMATGESRPLMAVSHAARSSFRSGIIARRA